ncbi:MAG: hypothetical protein ING31_08210 [Burkholderiales bacterium]|nr:hypothetical protein [Burkholderiales bacterium]
MNYAINLHSYGLRKAVAKAEADAAKFERRASRLYDLMSNIAKVISDRAVVLDHKGYMAGRHAKNLRVAAVEELRQLRSEL